MLYGIYNLPLPESEEGKMILLCSDSGYLGYYSKWNDIPTEHLRILGLYELVDVLKRHTKFEFEALISKYKIKETIDINYGKLRSELPLESISRALEIELRLPEFEFKDSLKLQRKRIDVMTSKNKNECTGIISMALCYKDKLNYTTVA